MYIRHWSCFLTPSAISVCRTLLIVLLSTLLTAQVFVSDRGAGAEETCLAGAGAVRHNVKTVVRQITGFYCHGRRSQGGQGGPGTSPPRIWSRGDAKANCPPQISSYRCKNERSVAFKIRQNPFSARALPRTPLGELTTLPDPLVGWGGNISPHTLPHSAPTHLRRSPCVSARSPVRFTPMFIVR